MSEALAPTAARAPYGKLRLPGAEVKLRNPVVVGVLTFVTLGVYTVAWWYLINRELAETGRALGRRDLGDDPAKSTLALFPGSIVVVPGVWTVVTTFQRVQRAQRLYGRVPIDGWLGLVLGLVLSPAMFGYLQSGLNSAWTAAADQAATAGHAASTGHAAATDTRVSTPDRS